MTGSIYEITHSRRGSGEHTHAPCPRNPLATIGANPCYTEEPCRYDALHVKLQLTVLQLINAQTSRLSTELRLVSTSIHFELRLYTQLQQKSLRLGRRRVVYIGPKLERTASECGGWAKLSWQSFALPSMIVTAPNSAVYHNVNTRTFMSDKVLQVHLGSRTCYTTLITNSLIIKFTSYS